MVWQDGETIVGNQDLLRLRLQIVSDNLVHKKLIPPMVHVLISPGSGGEAQGTRMRSIQYDTVSDRYGKYLLEEVLPEVEKSYKLRPDAYSRAIAGASSGAICALNVAWYHTASSAACSPHRQLRGAAVASRTESGRRLHRLQQGAARAEEESPRLAVGRHGRPGDQRRSWPLNNILLANALKLKGYDFHFRFGEGMHAIAQGALDLPESLTWLWRDYDPAKTAQTYEMEEAERVKPVFRVKIANRDVW